MHGSLKSFTNREIFDLEVVAYALNRGLVVPELLRIKRQPTLSFVSSSISHKARSVKSKSLISSSASKDFMRKL